MKKPKKLLKLPIINERFLTSLLKILSSNKSVISKKALFNIDYLLNMIDIPYYSKDMNVYSVILAIQIAIKQRENDVTIDADNLLSEIIAVIPESYNEQIKNIIEPTINLGKNLNSPTEVEKINSLIDLYLKHSTILLTKEKLSNALTEITSGNVTNLQASIDNYRNIVESISDEFRRTDSTTNNNTIHSNDEEFMDILVETYEQLKNPKCNLVTGLKMFNEMLSEEGGFRNGCFYIIYAQINSFKSATLEYCKKWIRKYNGDNFKKMLSETGLIPTILFYSLENTKTENMQRDFYMETGIQLKDVKSVEEAKKLWKEHYNSTNSPINVTYVYAESNTVKVSDVRRKIRSLKDEGYKVICTIIDYLELLRAEDEDIHLENRLKLGYISNALHVLAVSEDIVCISAMQLNRAAESAIMDLRNKGQTNIINQIGSMQFIGESYGIEKPVDGSFYIGIERSIYDNKLYLAIKRGKLRYKRTPVQYFVTELKNGFYIEDDYGTDKVTSLPSISPNANVEELEIEEVINKTKPNDKIRTIRDGGVVKKEKPVEKEAKKEEKIKSVDELLDMFKEEDDIEFESYKEMSKYDTPYDKEEE